MKALGLNVILLSFFFILSLIAGDVYADVSGDDTDGDAETMADEVDARREMGGEVSGHVVSVDPDSGSLVIRNASYGNKIFTVTVEDSTTYFGTESIDTIKPGDSISIDCFTVDDAYIAENIVMEKRAGEKESAPVSDETFSD